MTSNKKKKISRQDVEQMFHIDINMSFPELLCAQLTESNKKELNK